MFVFLFGWVKHVYGVCECVHVCGLYAMWMITHACLRCACGHVHVCVGGMCACTYVREHMCRCVHVHICVYMCGYIYRCHWEYLLLSNYKCMYVDGFWVCMPLCVDGWGMIVYLVGFI